MWRWCSQAPAPSSSHTARPAAPRACGWTPLLLSDGRDARAGPSAAARAPRNDVGAGRARSAGAPRVLPTARLIALPSPSARRGQFDRNFTSDRNFACNEKLHMPHTHTHTPWTREKKALERTTMKAEIPLPAAGLDPTRSYMNESRSKFLPRYHPREWCLD